MARWTLLEAVVQLQLEGYVSTAGAWNSPQGVSYPGYATLAAGKGRGSIGETRTVTVLREIP